MKQKIVHISDLHFDPISPEYSSQMLVNLKADLDSIFSDIRDENHRPVLIFTGDIVQSGAKKSQYEEFQTAFNHLFKSGTDNYFDKIILIPGNHDVDQSLVAKYRPMISGVSGELRDIDAVNSFTDPKSDLFTELMQNYVSFETLFSDLGACELDFFGSGHKLNDDVGIYCMNSAWYSFAGLETDTRKSDEGHLLASTRKITAWLQENSHLPYKIIAMHHPISWFRDDIRIELQRLISDHFTLCLFGHLHEAEHNKVTSSSSSVIWGQAGAISTKDRQELCYQVIQIDKQNSEIQFNVRVFAPKVGKFVSGSALTGNNDGSVVFSIPNKTSDTHLLHEVSAVYQRRLNDILAQNKYSKPVHVSPSISDYPEDHNTETETSRSYFAIDELVKSANAVIACPSQFGGTTLALEMCLEFSKQGTIPCYLETENIPSYESKFSRYLEAAKDTYHIASDLYPGVFVLDNFSADSLLHQRVLKFLINRTPSARLFLIEKCNQKVDYAHSIFEVDPKRHWDTFYLGSMSKQKVRELIHQSAKLNPKIDPEKAVEKITKDINSLNLHRIPQNVSMLLRVLEEKTEYTPLNRAEVVGRYFEIILGRFFERLDYHETLDFKDKIHLLSNLSEVMVREQSYCFDLSFWVNFSNQYKENFGKEFDTKRELDLFIKSGIFSELMGKYSFKFSMWTKYFIANQMNKDADFQNYILENRKYFSYPEVIEFAAGIERDQTTLVLELEQHLLGYIENIENDTGLSDSFDPYSDLRFGGTEEQAKHFEGAVVEEVTGKSLSQIEKDDTNDTTHNPMRPYQQAISEKFISENLSCMYSCMKALGLCLRNSEHVQRTVRIRAAETLFTSVFRLSQTIFALTPLIAEHGHFVYGGINFIYRHTPPENRDFALNDILRVLPLSIVELLCEYMGSSKFSRVLAFSNDIQLNQFNTFVNHALLVRNRVGEWEKVITRYIESLDKNSIYLLQMTNVLRGEHKYGLVNEDDRSKMKELMTGAVSRHKGKKKLGSAYMKKEAKNLKLS